PSYYSTHTPDLNSFPTRRSSDLGKEHTIGRLRISATTSVRPFQPDLLPASVVTILKKSPSERSESERDDLVEFYRSIDRQFIERSEEHTSELQSLRHLVCRLLLE